MSDKVLCDDCHEKEATRNWVTGHKLCKGCYDKWDEKNKKFREDIKNELKENIIGKTKEKGLMDY